MEKLYKLLIIITFKIFNFYFLFYFFNFTILYWFCHVST